MKKRVFSFLLCLLMVLVAGCSSSEVASGNTSSDKNASSVLSESSALSDNSSVVSSDTSKDTATSSNTATSSKTTVSSKPQSSKTSSLASTSSTTKPQNEYSHLIMMSDVHLEDYNKWYGLTSPQRISKMTEDLEAYYKKDKYENLFILGDTSLDFWENSTYGGSYRRHQRSNTKTLIDNYLSKLSCKNQYIIPGNHEQYTNADWKRITGRDRQYSVVINGWLFIMLDTFAGELGADYDHHGKYTGVDINFVKQEMAKYPDMPVVLCAHYFYFNNTNGVDPAPFMSFIKNEKRITCLFEGHDHVDTVEKAPAAAGGKTVFHCGNFSYTSSHNVAQKGAWGWRNVYIYKDRIEVDYYSPESYLYGNGIDMTVTAGRKQDFRVISNPLA